MNASALLRAAARIAAGAACLALGTAAEPPPAVAQTAAPTIAPDRCLALSQAPLRSLVQPASVRLTATAAAEVRISYVGHSTFLIESPKGIRIATDYNDYVRPRVIPEVVTMNRAHSTHYTDAPEAEIRHVLRGWQDGGAAMHDVTLADVRVRNVPTNIRSWEGGGTHVYGNSIFIFEIAGLCIAHLGHLHHTLTTQQLAQIGQMDVVLVPVDGSYTLDVAGMVEVLKALKAPLMIPMHYFSRFTLDRFLGQVKGAFEIVESAVPTTLVSKAKLPAKPQILVLPGG